MKCLEEGFEDSMTVMTLPAGMRKYFRTSNHIERLNRELKRRSNVIGVFPNEQSLLRLMGSVLIERNERPTKRYLAGRTARRYVCLMFPRCYLKSLMCSTACGRSNHIFCKAGRLTSCPIKEAAAGDNFPALAISRSNQAHFLSFQHLPDAFYTQIWT